MSYKDIAVEATKSAPPVTVTGVLLLGVPLDTWVVIITGVYGLLQIFFLLRDKWWRDRGRKD